MGLIGSERAPNHGLAACFALRTACAGQTSRLPVLPTTLNCSLLSARNCALRIAATAAGSNLLDWPTRTGAATCMDGETRMLLRHYLEQGSARPSCRDASASAGGLIHYWIATGQLDHDLAAGGTSAARRRPRKQKLDPYKAIIDERLQEFPRLSAQRLFDEVRAAGISRRLRSGEGLRERGPATRSGGARFETPAGTAGPGRLRHVHASLGPASRAAGGAGPLPSVVFYRRQTMTVLFDGLRARSRRSAACRGN